MTRWLVTGVSGLLGANAAIHLANEHQVIGTARHTPAASPVPFLRADLEDPRERDGLIERSRAEAVIHTAAIASIEACERDPHRAHALNATAAADLAGQAARARIPFVHISTDAVFDGSTGGYTEADEPSPTSAYGWSKLAGERAVLAANPDALVARVNFYGWSPSGSRSLAEFYHRRLSDGLRTPGFTDLQVSTLHVGLLVEALERLVEAGAHGVLHVVSSESTSKLEFGRALARAFSLDPSLVEPVLSTDHLATRRSALLGLSTARAERLLGERMPGQNAGLVRLLAESVSGVPARIRSYASTEVA